VPFTLAAVLGPQLKDIEREFHIYIDQRKFYYMVEPLRPAPDPPALQPAPAELVETSLGFLALGAERHELARQHADKAIALNAGSAEGHRLLAYLALENREVAEATSHAEAALAAGAQDSGLYMLLGDSYLNGANAREPNHAVASVNLYERAINLNPRQVAYYDRLTGAIVAIEHPRDEDAKFLQMGLKVFPGEDWVRVGIAAVDFRLGRYDSAMAALDAVLRPESTLDPSERTYANKLRITWLIQAMSSDVQDALNKNDYAGARAVITRCREHIGDDSDGAAYLQEVSSNVEVSELMARYNAARLANRKSEARSIAEQLLARPNLPGNLRSYLDKQPGGTQASKAGPASHLQRNTREAP
jgi:tetratricopeptide (TPR) repeat protein